jgi:hypothetical protein
LVFISCKGNRFSCCIKHVVQPYKISLQHIALLPRKQLLLENSDLNLPGFLYLLSALKCLRVQGPYLLSEESHYLPLFKFYKNIHIAVLPKIFADDRTKQGKSADMILFAEFSKLISGYGYLCLTSHSYTSSLLILLELSPEIISHIFEL